MRGRSPGRLRPGSGHARQRLAARPDADDCVANVICVRPTRRAASITVTTDWCGDMASALMITTLSRPALAVIVAWT